MSNLGPVTIDDFEILARGSLIAMAYDYFRSGADEEHSLRRNRDAFSNYEISHRTFVDVTKPSLQTTLLGNDFASPIAIAPTAYHLLAHSDGECGTARAAARANALYVASTLATTSLEDVATAAPNMNRWFQLYVHKDRAFTQRLADRAKNAGYRAIVITADTPVLGRRVADVKNDFALPDGLAMQNLLESLPPDIALGKGSELARYVAARHDPSLTWKDFGELVSICAPLPVVVKGIVRADDALRAIDCGASAIWVSNHGGRQLDFGIPTIDALGDVAAAVGSRAEIYFDGGVRSGTHALIALARGARAVFVGRPILWGLAVDGENGVHRVLDLLNTELLRAMQLAGCANASDAAPLVRRRP
ncbi:MAG: alpha-hydroxy acid oxidase [Polyangiaceae bacterium]